MARASALGLAYPQYASILLGTGCDVVAFLFTSGALGPRLERQLRLDAAARENIACLQQSERLRFSPSQEDPAIVLAMLDGDARNPFRGAGACPASFRMCSRAA